MDNSILPSSLKIATVEDSPMVAERLKQMFDEINLVEFVGNAATIEDAVQLVEKQRPSVIILDIYLKNNAPHRSGIDLLTTLRPSYPEMTIIMLTNLTGKTYRNRCLDMGANYFLDKSNDFEELPKILNTLLTITENQNQKL